MLFYLTLFKKKKRTSGEKHKLKPNFRNRTAIIYENLNLDYSDIGSYTCESRKLDGYQRIRVSNFFLQLINLFIHLFT